MKIKRIQTKNFRSISTSDMNLSKVNFILGQNNVGKSSLLNAMEYSLINSCGFSDKLQELKKIKGGTESFDGVAVSVDVEGLGVLMRYCKTGAQINRLNNEIVNDSKIKNEIMEKFKQTYDTLQIIFDSSKFTKMTPKEQKAFLLKLTGIHLNADTIISYMDAPSDKAKEFVKIEVQKELSIDDLDGIYKIFYNKRTNEKKNLSKITEKRILIENSIPKIEIKDEDSFKIRKEELAKILEDITKNVTLFNERTKQKRELEEKIAKGKENIKIVKEKIDKNIQVSETKIEEISNKINELEKIKSVEEREIGSSIEAKNRFVSLKTKLDTNKCPLSDKLICNTDKTPLLSEFDEQIKFYEKKEIDLKKKNEEYILEIKKLKEELEKIRKTKEYLSWIENNEQILKARIEEFDKLEIPNIDDIGSKKTKYEQELEKINLDLASIQKVKSLTKDLEKSILEEKEMEDTVQLCEYLVKEFETNGVRSRILKKIIAPLEEIASKQLSILNDGANLKFDFEGKDFEVLIENKTGIIPLRNLSTSEQLRVQIIIQDVINRLTGVGLLVIDEAGILDNSNFEQLITLLNQIADSYGTIMVALTKSKKDLSQISSTLLSCCNGDSSLFWVEDGEISKI